MTRDDIIRMAREAGGYVSEMPMGDAWLFHDAALERFAALVAEREREACARVCKTEAEGHNMAFGHHCAEAIRARGENK